MARTLTIVLFGLILVSACYGQNNERTVNEDEIMRALLRNGIWPDTKQLARFKRADEIRALKAAQVSAKGERATSIIWLFAALKYHYGENRLRLIAVRRILRQAVEKNDRLSKVAALCLRQINLAQKKVAENK